MIARRFAPALVVAALPALLLAADDPQPDQAARDEALEGNWVVVKAVRGGEEAEKAVGDKFTFRDGRVVISPDEDGGREEVATYALHPDQDPKQIDITPRPREDSDEKPPVVKGIYKIEGKTLTLCFANPREGGRPTDFASGEGSSTMLAVLERPEE